MPLAEERPKRCSGGVFRKKRISFCKHLSTCYEKYYVCWVFITKVSKTKGIYIIWNKSFCWVLRLLFVLSNWSIWQATPDHLRDAMEQGRMREEVGGPLGMAPSIFQFTFFFDVFSKLKKPLNEMIWRHQMISFLIWFFGTVISTTTLLLSRALRKSWIRTRVRNWEMAKAFEFD